MFVLLLTSIMLSGRCFHRESLWVKVGLSLLSLQRPCCAEIEAVPKLKVAFIVYFTSVVENVCTDLCSGHGS